MNTWGHTHLHTQVHTHTHLHTRTYIEIRTKGLVIIKKYLSSQKNITNDHEMNKKRSTMFIAFRHKDINMQRNISTYAHTFHLLKVKKLKSSISCLENVLLLKEFLLPSTNYKVLGPL